jgi:6-phosphofructokinase 2
MSLAKPKNNIKVITLTLSPCIDKSTRVEKFMPEKKLRCEHPVFEPGGGGLNVSRILRRVGLRSLAIYPSGGFMGRMLDEMVKHEKYDFIPIPSVYQTRENFIVYEKSSRLQFRFGMPENPLTPKEQKEILNVIQNSGSFEFFVLSGSAHSDVPLSFFRKLFSLIREKHAKIFVDTSRFTLKKIIPLHPDWIKPNRAEWLYYLNRKHISREDWIKRGRNFAVRHAINTVVSDGEQGAWFFDTTGNAFHYPVPSGIRVRSTVGAGDSMVAGIVFSLIQGHSPEESVRNGMAYASSTVTNPESEFCKLHQIRYWKKKILFRKLR